MTKHRSHSAAFKRQVAEEFIAGETLHALSSRRGALQSGDQNCTSKHRRRLTPLACCN
jgi:hypothetical protein